jgi:2-dehydropantoate 2-reductase
MLVVGAGAVGGYFGARLAEAGRDVTFLVRPRRAAELAKTGLRIVSPNGDLHIEPKLVTADALSGTYDVVFLSVKSYALGQAIDDFAPAVGAATMILPMLNGMRHMDMLIERFGEDAVVGGACRIASELDDDGRIVQLGTMQEVLYGERDGNASSRIQALDRDMSGAGFPTRLADDIVQDMWEKWVQLASLGALTCLFRGSVGDVEAVAYGEEMSLAILDECRDIAQACGHPPSAAFLAQMAKTLTMVGSSFTASMFRDLRKGNPVEVDSIIGDLLDRGRTHGIRSPLLAAAAVNLRVYEKQNAAS